MLAVPSATRVFYNVLMICGHRGTLPQGPWVDCTHQYRVGDQLKAKKGSPLRDGDDHIGCGVWQLLGTLGLKLKLKLKLCCRQALELALALAALQET